MDPQHPAHGPTLRCSNVSHQVTFTSRRSPRWTGHHLHHRHNHHSGTLFRGSHTTHHLNQNGMKCAVEHRHRVMSLPLDHHQSSTLAVVTIPMTSGLGHCVLVWSCQPLGS
ncbi:hypothetical protein Pelo_18845 [Pelomyxa schiedti]|nr:hypothetical protein Pelo_18845 [Pelomyxa schiedti]